MVRLTRTTHIRLNAYEVKQLEHSISAFCLLCKNRTTNQLSRSSTARRQLLTQIHQSRLFEYRGIKIITLPGVWRFKFSKVMFGHLLLCAMMSKECGWINDTALDSVIVKLKRANSR